jgi:hypothetical protein
VLDLVRKPQLRALCVAGARRVLTAEFDIRRMVSDLERLYLELLEPQPVAQPASEEIVRSA